ncbi:MAG: cyclic nucleotide-binding domain-containing protein [Deltaproteobacteria bacterium]|nr:cyclic nucleotide-binding domain-containing protein [Deltaproteobacteria bacterium]MBI4196931.1 cyclic nucleotide-binding domain-containing protein [Deltaproteobacteria bacterium]
MLPESHHWEDLVRKGEELVFRKGQVLFYEGHQPYGVYVVKSGEFSFAKEGVPCRGSHVDKVGSLKVLGLHDFFNGKPFCCTCTATADCRLIFLSRSQLTSH